MSRMKSPGAEGKCSLFGAVIFNDAESKGRAKSPASVLLGRSHGPSAQENHDHEEQENQRNRPPQPLGAVWSGWILLRFVELLPDEFIIIEFLVGNAELARAGAVRPAGGFIRAALRTGPGIGRHFRTAVGTVFG